MGMYLDSATDFQLAQDKLAHWADIVTALDANEVVGAEIVKKSNNLWHIELSFYVSKDSKEYKDFMGRFGR